MSILIPIEDGAVVEVDVLGVLAGDTALAGVLAVRNMERGNLAGSTDLVAALSAALSLSGNLAGDTAMPGFLRINAEPDLFLSGALVGDDAIVGVLVFRLGGAATFAGSTDMVGSMSVTSEDESSFVVTADILDAAIAAQGHIRRYAAKLLADGVEVKIRKAVLEAGTDTLGVELRVTLLRPDVALVSSAASITFQVGLWVNGAPGSFSWVTLISGGRLSATGNTLRNEAARPSDEVTLSVVDVVADRWNRAPRVPVHLYDPERVPIPLDSQLDANRIEVFGGGYIVPLNVQVPGMRLSTVLAQAYVVGCGFSSVVTNIPNFPVSEADFTLDGGYDGGVRSLLTPFGPVLFERGNVLYIIDPDAPLPAGMAARDLTHAQTREISDSVPQHEPVNALLVKIRASDGGEFYTERLDTENTSSGVFGSDGYTETDTERRTREYRNFSAPEVVVRQQMVFETVTVLDKDFNMIERTVSMDTFDLFNRKTGSTKRTDMRVPDPSADGTLTFMTDVTRQDQTITYRQDPLDPNKDLQDRVVTVMSGLVLVDKDNSYLNKDFKIPVLDAHRSGYIDPTGSQKLVQMDIRTTTEQLRVRGQQVDVEIRVIDHLADIPIRNTTTTRPAVADMVRKDQARGRTILLTTPGTGAVGRRAQTLDLGELPYVTAIMLGQRKLKRLNSPPREVSVVPGYVDVTINRGTVVSLKKRGGTELGVYIVRGWGIELAAYDQSQGVRASMTLQARELLT